jgi:uncharacterized membrane protein YedE/YeeE
MKNLVAVLAGAVFSAGLLLSGMVQPEKVRGFLDVTGEWDASLAFVMIGAIGVHAVLLRLIARRGAPVFMPTFQPRPRAPIDGSLLAGAAIFGVGWGLGGYCPGPGFVAAGGLSLSALAFVAALTVGMLAHRFFHQRAGVTAEGSQLTSK